MRIKQSFTHWMATVQQMSSSLADFNDAQLSALSSTIYHSSSESGSVGWIFRSLLSYVDEKINFLGAISQEHSALEDRRQELDRLSTAWTNCKAADKRRIQREWKALNDAILQGRKKLKRKLLFVIAEANDAGAHGLLSAEMSMFKQLQLVLFRAMGDACKDAGILATAEIQSELARFENALANYDSEAESDDVEIEPVQVLTPSFSSSISSAQSECSFSSSVSTASDKGSTGSSTASSQASQLQVFRNAKATMISAWEQMADDEQIRLISMMLAAVLDAGKPAEERLTACELALVEVEGVVMELCGIESRQPAALKLVHHAHGAIREFLMPELSLPEQSGAQTLVRLADFLLSYRAFIQRVCDVVVALRNEDHFHALIDDDHKQRLFQRFLHACDAALSRAGGEGKQLSAAIEDVQQWTSKTKCIQMRIIAIDACANAGQATCQRLASAPLHERINDASVLLPSLQSLAKSAGDCAEMNTQQWAMPGMESIDTNALVDRFAKLQASALDDLTTEDLQAISTRLADEQNDDVDEMTAGVRAIVSTAKEKLLPEVAKIYIRQSAGRVCEGFVARLLSGVTPMLERQIPGKSSLTDLFEAVAADEEGLAERRALGEEEVKAASREISAVKAAYAAGLAEAWIGPADDGGAQIAEMDLADRVLQLLQSPVEFIPVIVSNWCKDEPLHWRSFMVVAIASILARKEASPTRTAKLLNRLGGLLAKQDLSNPAKASKKTGRDREKLALLAAQMERIWPFLSEINEMTPEFEAGKSKVLSSLNRKASSARTSHASGGSSGGSQEQLLEKMKQLVDANQALEERLKCEEQRSEQLESVVENFQELFKEDLQALADA